MEREERGGKPMKCNYCQRNYKDLYIQEDEIIPVCVPHLNDHIESYEIADQLGLIDEE